jgi:hypothetical protein
MAKYGSLLSTFVKSDEELLRRGYTRISRREAEEMVEKAGEILADEFAVVFGYRCMHEVYAESDPIYEEGPVTWYITMCADGRYATWDDAELALDRVFFYESYEEAERALKHAWYESHALNCDVRPKYLSCLEVLKKLAGQIEEDHRRGSCNHYGDCNLVTPFVRFLEAHPETREQVEFYNQNDGNTLTPGELYDLMFYPFRPEHWIEERELKDWERELKDWN